jgi:hypothetical protein
VVSATVATSSAAITIIVTTVGRLQSRTTPAATNHQPTNFGASLFPMNCQGRSRFGGSSLSSLFLPPPRPVSVTLVQLAKHQSDQESAHRLRWAAVFPFAIGVEADRKVPSKLRLRFAQSLPRRE